MKRQWMMAAGLAAGLVGASAAVSANAADTAIPNFSGVWQRANESWYHAIPGDPNGKPLERISKNPEQEAGDYKNPILKPWTAAVVKANAEQELNDHYVPTAHGTCWPSGVPEVLNLREPVQLLQQPDEITIIYARDHQVRHVYLNRAHSKNVPLSWYGESVGHYEGKTLVVDTIGQAPFKMSVVDPYGTPHTAQIHVVERYTLIHDKKGPGLHVTFTVEDPGAFTMPWRGMLTYRRSRGGFDEVICAENNRTFGEDSQLGQMPKSTKDDF